MSTRNSIAFFDLDGTLTLPYLDFDAIRKEIGISEGLVLESLETMSDQHRKAAEDILQRHETEAAENSELRDSAAETVAELRRRGWLAAIVTRNARRSTHRVLDLHGIKVDAVWTREDGPVKPSPHAILTTCKRFGVRPEACWMIGDFHVDIRAGRAAGTTTVLLVNQPQRPEFATEADYVISNLSELLDIMP